MRQADHNQGMPDTGPLDSLIKELASRIRVQRFLRWCSIGVIAASTLNVALLIFGAERHRVLVFALSGVLLYILAVGAAVVIAATSKLDSLAVIRHAEEKLGLSEQLSTALALRLSGNNANDLLTGLVIQRAVHDASFLDPKAVVRARWRWEYAAAAIGALAVLATLWSLRGSLAAAPLEIEDTALREAASILASASQAHRAGGDSSQAAKQIAQIASQMKEGKLTREQAQQKLAQVISKALAQSATSGSKDAGTAGNSQDAAAIGKALKSGGEQLQAALRSSAASHRGDKQFQQVLQDAAKLSRSGSAQDLSKLLSDAAEQQPNGTQSSDTHAASQLRQLANSLTNANMPQTQNHIAQAAKDLQRGDAGAAKAQLQKAQTTAQQEAKSARQSASSSAGQQQLDNLKRAVDEAQQRLSQGPGSSTTNNAHGTLRPSQAAQNGPSRSGGTGKSSAQKSGSQIREGGPGASGGTAPGGSNQPAKIGGKTASNLASGHASIKLGTPVSKADGASAGLGSHEPLIRGAQGSTVAYYSVSPTFKRAAESAIEHEEIPPSYKRQVRAYFSSLPTH